MRAGKKEELFIDIKRMRKELNRKVRIKIE